MCRLHGRLLVRVLRSVAMEAREQARANRKDASAVGMKGGRMPDERSPLESTEPFSVVQVAKVATATAAHIPCVLAHLHPPAERSARVGAASRRAARARRPQVMRVGV